MFQSTTVDERSRRILATAVDLAEKGGFEAVRLRDVAAHAGVALGTLYRHFRSKEDLLVAALTLEVERLEQRMAARVVRRVRYRVKRGDTLVGIARRHGVSVSELRRWNPATRRGHIYPGQVISIHRGGR